MYHAAMNVLTTRAYQNGEDELMHFGILGQKWGIRRYQNEDGSLTPEGRIRYGINPKKEQQIRNIIRNSRYNEDVSNEVFSIANADKTALNEARKIIAENREFQKQMAKEQSEMFEELESDKPTETYYEVTSEIADFCDTFGGPDKMTMEDVRNASYMGLFEDGQQGSVNAYSLYAHDNGLVDKVSKLYDESTKHEEECDKAAAAVIQNALDKVGGEGLRTNPDNPYSKSLFSDTIAGQMRSADHDGWYNFGNGRKNSAYLLGIASEASAFDKSTQKNIDKAKSWVSKIDNNTDPNTWDALNDALDYYPDLARKNPDDLTQSDWDKINKKIYLINNGSGIKGM